jgi:hypothetical protein
MNGMGKIGLILEIVAFYRLNGELLFQTTDIKNVAISNPKY